MTSVEEPDPLWSWNQSLLPLRQAVCGCQLNTTKIPFERKERRDGCYVGSHQSFWR